MENFVSQLLNTLFDSGFSFSSYFGNQMHSDQSCLPFVKLVIHCTERWTLDGFIEN